MVYSSLKDTSPPHLPQTGTRLRVIPDHHSSAKGRTMALVLQHRHHPAGEQTAQLMSASLRGQQALVFAGSQKLLRWE